MSLIFLGLAWLVLPLTEGAALVKDAACQAAVDSVGMMTILSNPCQQNGTATECPAACAAAIATMDSACKDKNYETTDSETNTKEVIPFSDHRGTVIFVLEMFAKGDVCKKVLFDEGYKSAISCKTANGFAAKEIFYSPWCATTAGGDSEKSCHANCQKTIDVVKSKCKDGDSMGKDSDGTESTYNSYTLLGYKILGPSTCDYTASSGLVNSAITTSCAFAMLFGVALAFLSTFA